MKGAVINLAYMLAKIKEPGNPRLSEGDIIRQMNRISDNKAKARMIVASVNTVKALKDRMISQIHETPTGAVGVVFGVMEGI